MLLPSRGATERQCDQLRQSENSGASADLDMYDHDCRVSFVHGLQVIRQQAEVVVERLCVTWCSSLTTTRRDEHSRADRMDCVDFVFIALVFSLAHTGLMLAQTKFARHQWDVRACWYDGTYTKVSFSRQQMNDAHNC